MYNLIEHSDIYLKTSGSLWQCYRDEPALVTQENAKLYKQLKSGFKKTINWNKYQSE